MMDFAKYPSGMSKWHFRTEFAQFRKDALEAAEMPLDHPSVDLAFDHAWEEGHAHGLEEVVSQLVDLVEIIKPNIWQELQAVSKMNVGVFGVDETGKLSFTPYEFKEVQGVGDGIKVLGTIKYNVRGNDD